MVLQTQNGHLLKLTLITLLYPMCLLLEDAFLISFKVNGTVVEDCLVYSTCR